MAASPLPPLPSRFTISAPGKTILLGEHAVVYGHQAVAASIGLRTTAQFTRPAAVAAPDGVTAPLVVATMGLEWVIDGARLLDPTCRWEAVWDASQCHASLLASAAATVVTTEQARRAFHAFCTIARLAAAQAVTPPAEAAARLPAGGFSLEYASALPVGAGLGSSAAFNVVTAAVWSRVFGLLSDGEPHHTADSPGARRTWHAADLARINAIALEGERVMHGTPSGLDNTLSTYGGICLYTPQNMRRLPPLTGHAFTLVDTGVPKDTQHQLTLVRERLDRWPGVYQPLLESIHALGLAFEQVFVDDADGKTDPVAFLREAITTNHLLLQALGVSHPSLDALVDLARARGLAAKMTGAGGGGCALIYHAAPPGLSPEEGAAHVAELHAVIRASHPGMTIQQAVVGDIGVCLHDSL
ncbi:hypothetical protein CXG81DRAFT_10797 [Caulochytrium protostelioides]|uniref:Mevalonate kinase n=1 Tax=Caulochytrium protostelioides TaxID=1555241 RepID=A0A4P9XAM5_9FUNG|nr:hypothetical protein CXG81DRAFT_10797 [Caulochytrium protostelioides]|eukprot:RKP02417.1 hypothetical protein CXG81DRAFT_10797 [Caulochytrium protostelioides]